MTESFPPPGAPSTPPCWEDIERLAMFYPAAQMACEYVRRGDLTREQALICAFFAMTDGWQKFFHAERQRVIYASPGDTYRRMIFENLVKKLDEMFSYPAFRGAFGFATVHGYSYNGPSIEQQLKDAKTCLDAW